MEWLLASLFSILALQAAVELNEQGGVVIAAPPAQRNRIQLARQRLSDDEGTIPEQFFYKYTADVHTKWRPCTSKTTCITWYPKPTLPGPRMHIMASMRLYRVEDSIQYRALLYVK